MAEDKEDPRVAPADPDETKLSRLGTWRRGPALSHRRCPGVPGPPYLDAGVLHHGAVQGLYGQLRGFQHFVLHTEVWLQETRFPRVCFPGPLPTGRARGCKHRGQAARSHVPARRGCAVAADPQV